MHVRVVTFTGAKNIDDGLTFLRETVVPLLSAQKGYRGVTVSADRAGGVFGVLSLWETEADRDESDKALTDARQEGLRIVGGEVSVENFEQVVLETGDTPPGPGAALLVQRVSMEPAKVDENLAFFKSDVAPRMKANAGFLAVRNLMNRATGQGIVGTVWTNTEALRAALAQGQERRQEAMARGVNFGDMSEREILFADVR